MTINGIEPSRRVSSLLKGLSTAHIAHLCKQFNQFKQLIALPISMPRFKSIIFHQYSPKIKLFKKKMQNFQALGAPPPNPRASGGWGLCPQTPQNSPLNGEFLATCLPRFAPLFIIIWVFVGFCFEQCFLDRSVANLKMLTIDVCLIVFCLKSFICITHCVTLTPSCYITLSYLFAKV